MGDREPEKEALDHLGCEARSVLAVLVMAALWPGRYPGGWVSVGDFARAGVLLGERSDRESLKAAIRRGLRRLAAIPAAPGTECRRTLEQDSVTSRVRRDRDRRLAEPPGPLLERWLLSNGSAFICPDLWREFLPTKPRPIAASTATRELLRQSLLQAEACLGFAALVVPPGSPEGLALRRIRRAVSRGIRAVQDAGGSA